jgi:hypothetical protein
MIRWPRLILATGLVRHTRHLVLYLLSVFVRGSFIGSGYNIHVTYALDKMAAINKCDAAAFALDCRFGIWWGDITVDLRLDLAGMQ